jgi:hypothetical protein
MDKRHAHHIRTKLRVIKPWYFLAIAIVSAVICVLALRSNNQHMVLLRDAVYAADRNNTDIQKPLQDLQAYVTTHMNTDLNAGKNAVYPPIQLKYTYERLVQSQGEAASRANSALYSAAQAHCEQQNPSDFSGRNRVPCIEQYVQSHRTQATTPAIPDALYKFAFTSPKWSPDLAGWTMVIAIVSLALFVVSFIANRWLRRNT